MMILIVEDNEDSRVLLESFLSASGFAVMSAENGKAALDLARLQRPDLIISDIMMPEMDGYALCRAVKADARLQAIPVVFYTATYTEPADERLAMDLGAARFIVKPMEMDIFLAEIKAILETHGEDRLFVQEPPLKSEEELQKGYAGILAKKLDKKIRELEEKQRGLENSELQYRRLVEALRADYFFYTYDPQGVLTYVSPAISMVLGYTPEEFRGRFSEYFTGHRINQAALSCIKQSLTGEKQPPYELEVYGKDGTAHRLEVTEEPVLEKTGQVVAVEGIAHDTTKRLLAARQLIKAQETLQQSQKMEAIGTLAGGIAHDFNNILTPIIGFAEIAQLELPEGTKAWECLQEVLHAASRAKELVSQILTFSRYDEQEKKPVLMQALVKEILKLLRSSIPTTIEIRAEVNPDCGAIAANSTQMHQILMNLCTNAYYAMRQVGGVLTVTLAETEIGPESRLLKPPLPAGKYIRLAVSDTGPGIEPAMLERIFEPYYTTKPKGEGTGLGLSVVHGIVREHGGQITVDSELGRGTTFTVYLPIIVTNQESPQAAFSPGEVCGGTERVLLVDDDEVICFLEKIQLESIGYQVTALTSSLQAAEIFQAAPHHFDLLITDMTMPGMTGAMLSQTVLLVRPEMPIILCTGFSELMDPEKAAALGVKEYLLKPLSLRELAAAIRRVLDPK